MPYFPDDVVAHILGSVTSHRDRNAASLVCRAWYGVECLTRCSVFVPNCYAVRPERVLERFPCLRSLSVKGKPHFADYNLVLVRWGAAAEPWVDVCARTCPGLEELRLKRMVVTDDCLKKLARAFPGLKSLVLVSCEGLSTDGLAAIATSCRYLAYIIFNSARLHPYISESLLETAGDPQWNRCRETDVDYVYFTYSNMTFLKRWENEFLKELDLKESLVEVRGSHWLSCFPKPSTSLESLNFACLTGAVNDHALEGLVRRSPNLKNLRLSCSVSLTVLAKILSRRPKLVDLGTGWFAGFNNAVGLRLYSALQHCNSLKILSGFWDFPRFVTPAIHFVCKNLTCLNLSYAPTFRRDNLIEIIRPCQNLQQLWVLDHICDVGLKSVASSCMELQELRVLPANTNVLASTGVTEQGLVAISSGCRKLNSVLYFCQRMTNAALIIVAKNCPQLTSFRLCSPMPRSADAMTGKPLDEGFGAIAQSCKDLRRLSMSGLLTDSVFLYIGMYAERLETLSVAFAGDTDNGMIYVLNGCKNLKKLVIRNCPFGDTALLAGMHRYEAMRSLWMSSCNITLGGCKALAANKPSLNVEATKEVATIAEADGDASSAKVEKLYVYRSVAGPRGDAPAFISPL